MSVGPFFRLVAARRRTARPRDLQHHLVAAGLDERHRGVLKGVR